MGTYKDLIAYEKSFALAMKIFEITKGFPKEEKYSLIDQVRRSSRSICINIVEAYRKRQYPMHFVSKLSDADMENSETIVWIDFAIQCKYLEESLGRNLISEYLEIGKLIQFMMNNPEKFGPKKSNK